KRRWSALPRMRRPKFHQGSSKGLKLLRDVRSLRSTRFEFRQLLGDIVELLADRRKLEPQLIQAPREIKLFLKFSGRRFNARIHCYGQRAAESFAVNCQRNRVITQISPRR